MPIEDNFRPETATELALMNRIRELRLICYENGNFDGVSSIANEEVTLTGRYDPPMTLQLAASAKSGWENERLIVTARTFGPNKTSLGSHCYMSREQIETMTPTDAVRMCDNLHRDVMNRLAKVLGEKR